MGSRENEDSPPPICIDCDKKNQKDLPQTTPASEGMACEAPYAQVTSCMNDNAGQISACKDEWNSFRQCFDDKK